MFRGVSAAAAAILSSSLDDVKCDAKRENVEAGGLERMRAFATALHKDVRAYAYLSLRHARCVCERAPTRRQQAKQNSSRNVVFFFLFSSFPFVFFARRFYFWHFCFPETLSFPRRL